MANIVTIKDVAQLAEVSIGTVSRVFNHHSNVNGDIRERVLKAAAELGYSGPAGRSSTVQKKGKALKEIGFLLYLRDSTEDGTIAPFWANILHGAEAEAQKSNIKVTYQAINSTRETPQSLPGRLHEMRLGGVLLVGPADAATIDAIRSLNIPLVLVDNYMRRPALDAVLSANFEGTMEAIEYLISQGHRRIAAICGPLSAGPHPTNILYTIEWRIRGYREALLNAGLSVDESLIEVCVLSPEGGYETCKRLIARGMPCSAIFCANDPTAIGVLKALREEGFRVPQDVSVVGFDDDMAEYLTPALTTVRVNKEAMGATAVNTLIERFKNPGAVAKTITLGVELIKRDSVGPLSSHRDKPITSS
ncbi:MAG TPA: LacI family DNA-binding transcriptional regulator [Ktedonobacteraceae bacterium]|nr:LacI family DNA-binding transcriptional regulator [Ktedonobacteraceae bacterium]